MLLFLYQRHTRNIMQPCRNVNIQIVFVFKQTFAYLYIQFCFCMVLPDYIFTESCLKYYCYMTYFSAAQRISFVIAFCSLIPIDIMIWWHVLFTNVAQKYYCKILILYAKSLSSIDLPLFTILYLYILYTYITYYTLST